MSNKPIEESQITTLLLGLEHRGKRASGVLLVDKDSPDFHILKDASPAASFTESKRYKDFMTEHLSERTRTVLVHARFDTVGSPFKNENNHPVFSGTCAVVHNGSVSNHREMFEKMKLTRQAEVDTDIIRAVCDEEGLTHKTVRELSRLSGSIAAAVVDKRNPNNLLLLRSGNPLCIGMSEDHIIFASVQKVVAAAARTWKKRYGVWCQQRPKDIEYSIFPSDSAWFFNEQEREWHQKFQTAAYTYNPSNWDSWYGAESDEFAGTEVDLCGRLPMLPAAGERDYLNFAEFEYYYRCPKCSCRCLINETNKHLEQAVLICTHCKTSLAKAVLVGTRKGLTD